MASYIPESVRRQAAALNDAYNPLSAAQQPSQAHGKYSYAKGIVYQSYGEAVQSPPWIASGAQLKAAGVMEMQAAAAGKSAQEFADLLRNGDPGVGATARAGVGVAGDAGNGVADGATIFAGGVVGVSAEKGADTSRHLEAAGEDVGRGVASGVEGVGRSVGDGVRKGLSGIGVWGRR